MEDFHRFSDYQRDLNKTAMDSFLADFKDYHGKVLQKYPKVDLGDGPLIDAPSMPQVMDSPTIGGAETLVAPPKKDDVVEI